MKRKEVKFAALAAACTVIAAIAFTVPHLQGTSTSSSVAPNKEAVAGISLPIDNYYKKTFSEITSSINMTDAFLYAKKNVAEQTKEDSNYSQYKHLGIAHVANYLNIRKKANDTSDIVGILPKNGGCYIYSIDKNGWAKIKSGKVTGYVSTEFLVTGKEVVDLAKKVGSMKAIVNTTTVRMREKKSKDSKTLALIPKGEELEVLNDSDKAWVYVRLDGDKGYISKELVDIKYQLDKATKTDENGVAAVAASGGRISGISRIRSQMVSYAKKFIGGKYVYGGTSLTKGIDCSAFMMRIYEHFGYSITRTSRSQAAAGTAIKLSKVKPGDLVFYDQNGTISHVGMYIGNGKIIHASNPKSGIKISNMYYKMPFKAVRFLDE